MHVQFDISDNILLFSDKCVIFCGLILGSDTLLQYLYAQKLASEGAEILRKMMYFLTNDKTGRLPFCFFGVETLIAVFDTKSVVRREYLPTEQAIN